mmetsp:Transcript_5443/g.4131  ORF Transcript_5443/g.4131 Transcript_5443/m.4131 type:complete len:147 (+) Transcript_5443:118-558(+)
MFTFATLAYYKKLRGLSKETILFLFFSLEMLAVVAYDLGSKYIIVLYMMMLFSNYATFFAYSWLITHQFNPNAEEIVRMYKPYFISFNILYALCLVILVSPEVSVQCNDKHIYPGSFIFNFSVNLIFTVFIWIFSRVKILKTNTPA